MSGRRTFCCCDRPVITKTIWAGDNAGRRFERCATKECPYDIWIDEPLPARAVAAIEQLVREKNELHRYYEDKLYSVREWESRKRHTLVNMLHDVEMEVRREEPDDVELIV